MLLVYLATALWCMHYTLWYVNGADAFQYIRIAERYAAGDIARAVNGHWSPLISWLLVPLLPITGNGIIAFKVLQPIIGAATLLAWDALLRATRTPGRTLLLWAAVPMVLAQGLLVPSPDLLFVAILFTLLTMAVHGGLQDRSFSAALFGTMGALLYLTKQFGLPLFVLLLIATLWTERHTTRMPFAKVVHRGAMALGVCVAVSLPWIMVLSIHQGHATIGEAARYNLTPGMIDAVNGRIVHPAFSNGLWDVPAGAVSVWEEPLRTVSMQNDAPRSTLLERIGFNLRFVYYHQIRRQVGTVFLAMLAVALFLPAGRTRLGTRPMILCGTVLLGLWLGYAPVLVQDRYIWANGYLMLLVIAQLMQAVAPQRNVIRTVVLCAVLLLAIKRPVKQFLYSDDVETSASELVARVMRPAAAMEANFMPEARLMNMVQQLRSSSTNRRFASLHEGDGIREWHGLTMQMAHLLDGSFHGNLPAGPSTGQMEALLHEQRVDRLVVWGDAPWQTGTLVVQDEQARVYDVGRAADGLE